MPTTERPERPRTGGSRVLGLLRRRWLAVVLIIVAIIFVVQNRSQATIELFTGRVTMPQWLILAIVFAIGLLAGYLLGRGRGRRR